MKSLLENRRIYLSKHLKSKLTAGAAASPRNKKPVSDLEKQYKELCKSKSKSLLRRHLGPKLFKELKEQRTPTYSSGLYDCIQCGLKLHASPIGIYAADGEAYKVYNKLFDPIIQDINGIKRKAKQPDIDFGDIDGFRDIDPYNHFILSTRIRALRNLEGFPFTPRMEKSDYKRIEEPLKIALKKLKNEQEGLYFRLDNILKSTRDNWIENHMYRTPSRLMESAEMCRFHPTGRGFFHNVKNSFSVWTNHEDHLRIVSMQQGAHFGQVYRRLVNGLDAIEVYLPFLRDKRLGYLTCSPQNLGTGIRVSVLIKLIKLPANKSLFKDVIEKFNLQVRGTYGQGTEVEKCIYDISNRYCLGQTEFEVIKRVYDGVAEIMYIESSIKHRDKPVQFLSSLLN